MNHQKWSQINWWGMPKSDIFRVPWEKTPSSFQPITLQNRVDFCAYVVCWSLLFLILSCWQNLWFDNMSLAPPVLCERCSSYYCNEDPIHVLKFALNSSLDPSFETHFFVNSLVSTAKARCNETTASINAEGGGNVERRCCLQRCKTTDLSWGKPSFFNQLS